MTRIRITIPAALLVLALAAGCASKSNVVYTGQCAVSEHSFCNAKFDELSQCDAARRQHDRDTGRAGTCSRG